MAKDLLLTFTAIFSVGRQMMHGPFLLYMANTILRNVKEITIAMQVHLSNVTMKNKIY